MKLRKKCVSNRINTTRWYLFYLYVDGATRPLFFYGGHFMLSTMKFFFSYYKLFHVLYILSNFFFLSPAFFVSMKRILYPVVTILESRNTNESFNAIYLCDIPVLNAANSVRKRYLHLRVSAFEKPDSNSDSDELPTSMILVFESFDNTCTLEPKNNYQSAYRSFFHSIFHPSYLWLPTAFSLVSDPHSPLSL